MPNHFVLIVFATALAVAAWSNVAGAQSSKAGAYRVPMHPSTLTLRSHGRANVRGHHRTHNRAGNTHRTPIHGTMAGPRI